MPNLACDLRASGGSANGPESEHGHGTSTRQPTSSNASTGHGFVTDIEQDTVPPGLSEDVIRFISAKKGEPEFLTEWRLKAYRHWLTMREPDWAHVR